MKYLVTGGAGFIGSNIVEELLKRGHYVRVLDNFSTGKRENLIPLIEKINKPPKNTEGAEKNYDAPAGVKQEGFEPPKDTEDAEKYYDAPAEEKQERFEQPKNAEYTEKYYDVPAEEEQGAGSLEIIEGDLRSEEDVLRAVEGVDYILHQGALPSVPMSIDDPVTATDVNVMGTLNVLEAAKKFGVKRVVFASSCAIYGNLPELPKREEMPKCNLSPYALTKAAAEEYCQIYYQLYGLETVALRYFNVFGPRQDPTSQYSAVIPKFITAMAEGREPVIYGDGLQTRDFVYVENVVQANLLACSAPGAAGEVINIACGERYSLIELVERLNGIMGSELMPLHEAAALGDVRHSMASISKAREVLGYEVKVSFEEGLRKTVEFFTKK